MMRVELFVDIADAIENAVDTNKSCTEYINGKLTEPEIASLEDTSHYRVELSVCEQMFRIWIVAHLHDIGFTGLF